MMQLVVSEDAIGIWLQLEGDTAAEWEALERVAAQGERAWITFPVFGRWPDGSAQAFA